MPTLHEQDQIEANKAAETMTEREALETLIQEASIYGMFIGGILPMGKLQSPEFQEAHKSLGDVLNGARKAIRENP